MDDCLLMMRRARQNNNKLTLCVALAKFSPAAEGKQKIPITANVSKRLALLQYKRDGYN